MSGQGQGQGRGTGQTYQAQQQLTLPAGYRHLAYIQLGIGYDVKLDMPQLSGPEVDELYARGRRWLSGEIAGHPAGES